jgi:hypothetical protein
MNEARLAAARRVPVEGVVQAHRLALKKAGGELIGPCPKCGGKDRFAVSLQKQVFNCRGCGARGDVIALEMFLSGSDFSAAIDTLAGAPREKRSRRAAITYQYCDPRTGEVRYCKKRFENADGSKTFCIEPKQHGGSEPLLYGGERIADEGQPLFIVEGEKQVERLRQLGAIAVSGDTGAKSKWLPEHARLLRGLPIVLWPDSDEAGERYVANAAAAVLAKDAVADIRIVRPFGPPNGSKGLDVCDWAGDADELQKIIEEAEPYRPPPSAGDGAAEAATAGEFQRGENGQVLKGHPGNIARAIKLLGIGLRHNEFSFQTEISGLPGFGPILNDTAASQLRIQINESFGFVLPQELYEQVLDVEAHKSRLHPIRDYLNGLEWDRRERLGTWLSQYLGAEQGPYAETIGRAFFVALVARIFIPGCKQDYMMILEGPQGALKSMACEAIAGEWFSDNLPDLREGKDVSQHLQGKWLIEVGELSAMSRAEAAVLKAFVTRRTERYRPSYGRREIIQPRQCVFIGTTNNETYLKDPTGGRRFWPIKIGKIDLEALKADRNQLFAEAVSLFKAGSKWWPERQFELEIIKPEQEARYAADPWEEAVAEFLKAKERVTVAQIARGALFIDTTRIGTTDNLRIIQIRLSSP